MRCGLDWSQKLSMETIDGDEGQGVEEGKSVLGKLETSEKDRQMAMFRQKFAAFKLIFLVACYATLHPALSVRRSVRRSIRRSFRPSHCTFFGFLGFLTSLLLPK